MKDYYIEKICKKEKCIIYNQSIIERIFIFKNTEKEVLKVIVVRSSILFHPWI